MLIFNGISLFKYINFDTKFIVNSDESNQFAYFVNKSWGQRHPILTISNDDEEWGEDLLKSLGLKEGQWYVCIHARDPYYSKIDEKIQSYRNSNIENLRLSVQEIRAKGGMAIRVGTRSREIPVIDGLIDYPNGSHKSDRADIYLIARAKFILGNTSGIALLGSVFGTPCALANMIPMSVMGIGVNDISIPKLLMQNGKIMNFNEIMNSDVSNYRHSNQYDEHSIEVIESNEKDILMLTMEMFDFLEGRVYLGDEIKIRNDYKSLLKPKHYGYGAASNISVKFLTNYQNLWKKNGTI